MKLLLIKSHIRKVQEHGEVKLSGLHLKSFFESENDVQVDPDEMRGGCSTCPVLTYSVPLLIPRRSCTGTLLSPVYIKVHFPLKVFRML